MTIEGIEAAFTLVVYLVQEQVKEKQEVIQGYFKTFALSMHAMLPDSEEKNLCISKLQEAGLLAYASVAIPR